MIIDFINHLKHRNKIKEISLKEISKIWIDSEEKEASEQIKHEGDKNKWDNPDISPPAPGLISAKNIARLVGETGGR